MTNKQHTPSNTVGFWGKLTLFTLPFAVGFVVLTGLLIWSGESMPLQVVAAMQQSDTPVLYRVKYGNRDQQFKRVSVDTHTPDVLVLGSSRMLQFRGHFTNRDYDAFYNAAAPAWQLDEVERLLTVSDHTPDVLLLGIDPPWFNAAYEGDPIVEPPMNWFNRLFLVNRTYLQAHIDEIIAPDDSEDPPDLEMMLQRNEPGGSGGIALGLRAQRDGHGFRNDGSEQYGDFLVAQWLYPPNIRGRDLGWVDQCEDMYVCGDTVDADALAQLERILDYAQSQDILVIGMMPPYMPSLWDKMMSSGQHTYIQKLLPQVESLFAEYDYPYFDYSDGATVGATDDDFFDGWHASEKIAAQMWVNITREVPALQAYTNADALQQRVNNAANTFRVFDFIADEQQTGNVPQPNRTYIDD